MWNTAMQVAVAACRTSYESLTAALVVMLQVSSLNPRGLDMVITLLQEHNNDVVVERLYQSKVFELCVSQLSTLLMGPALNYVAQYLVDKGTLDVMWDLVHNTNAPMLARSRGAQVFHVLACTEEGLKVTQIAKVSELLVYLMQKDKHLELQVRAFAWKSLRLTVWNIATCP